MRKRKTAQVKTLAHFGDEAFVEETAKDIHQSLQGSTPHSA